MVFNPEKKTIGWYYDSSIDANANLEVKKIILLLLFL